MRIFCYGIFNNNFNCKFSRESVGKNIDNRLRFDEVTRKSLVSPFFCGTRCTRSSAITEGPREPAVSVEILSTTEQMYEKQHLKTLAIGGWPSASFKGSVPVNWAHLISY